MLQFFTVTEKSSKKIKPTSDWSKILTSETMFAPSPSLGFKWQIGCTVPKKCNKSDDGRLKTIFFSYKGFCSSSKPKNKLQHNWVWMVVFTLKRFAYILTMGQISCSSLLTLHFRHWVEYWLAVRLCLDCDLQ